MPFTAILAALMPSISSVLDRVIPDKNKRAEVQAELQLKLMEQENRVTEILASEDAKQADINLEEAKSPGLFKSGARPFILWVCGIAFAWQYVLQPVVVFILAANGYSLKLPAIDFSTMSTVLFGLLGLGGLRTYEKVKGVTK